MPNIIINHRIIVVSIILICISVFSSLTGAQQQYTFAQDNSIIDALLKIPDTRLFVSHLLKDPFITTYLKDQINRDITIFAPNNEAFLSYNDTVENWWYHILPTYCLDWNKTRFERTLWNNQLLKLSLSATNSNQKVVISGMMHNAKILQTLPINQTNNIIHIIDQKLTLPVDINTTLSKLGYTKARDMFAKEIENMTTKDQITLFVPNNNAFGTVDPTTLDNLLAQTHASIGTITSDMWENSTNFESLINGINLTVAKKRNITSTSSYYWEVQESDIYPAKIALTDVLLENGMMHIIEGVLWANDWDRITKSKSNASQTQPIICLLALNIILSLLSC